VVNVSQNGTADEKLLHGDVRSWLRDDVVKFVTMVPGCSEYAEVTVSTNLSRIGVMPNVGLLA